MSIAMGMAGPVDCTAYETEMRYLEYDTGYDKISIPLQIRERHFTEDTDTIHLQAVGTHFNGIVWSDRDDVIFQFPVTSFYTSDMVSRKMSTKNKCIVSVGQFEDRLANDEKEIKARVIVGEVPRS